MAKTKISEFSSTPANNTDIDSINIAEGCAPSNINDAIRELMAQLKDFQIGSQGDSFNGPIGTSTAAAGAFTTLSASSTVTLSGGTANGVTYLNGSKVLTSGSALTFDGNTFGVNSGATALNANFNSTNASGVYVRFQNSGTSIGDIGAGAQVFSGGTAGDLGISSRAGSLVFGQNNTEGMRLTSTGLGIGTSSPAYKLDVNIASGSVRINSNTGSANSAGYLLGNSLRAWSILTSSGTGGPLIISDETAGGAVRATLDSSGNLGLGVTPSASTIVQFEGGSNLLMVGRGNAYLSNNATYNSGFKYINTSTAGQYNISGSTHSWYTAPSGTAGNAITFTQAMTLDASGNLGVGTTSPSQRLHVSNASGGSNILVANGTNSASNIYVATDGFAATTGSIYTNGSAPLAFGTNSTERARIDSSGSFMVGNTSVSNTVAGFYTSLNGTIIVHTNSSSFSQPLLLNRENSDGDAIVFRRANSTVGSISVTTTATAYNTSSDYRLKNITGALTGYKERLMSLLPKQGTWIIDGSEFRGFVAHEFATPYRASVTGEKDAVDADGNPIMQSMQASSSEVMADLVALVQEQQAIIESLKARLDAANL